MSKCDQCGTTILFGGVREAGYLFCGKNCHANADFLIAAASLPDDVVAQHAQTIHQGPCAKCGGRGPVDVHTAHSVWSALVITNWRSTPRICCQSCGTKSRLQAIATSGILGWWGMPWGLLVTPVQILRNVGGLFSAPDPDRPSAELVQLARRDLMEQVFNEQCAQQASQAGPGQ